MAFFGHFGVSAGWPKFRPNCFGRFSPKFRPKFRFRSYTTNHELVKVLKLSKRAIFVSLECVISDSFGIIFQLFLLIPGMNGRFGDRILGQVAVYWSNQNCEKEWKIHFQPQKCSEFVKFRPPRLAREDVRFTWNWFSPTQSDKSANERVQRRTAKLILWKIER